MPTRIWLLLMGAGCAAAQSIQGTVVNSVTGVGIPGGKVELVWSGELAYGVTSDGQGRFAFQVDAGAYTVRYTVDGYEWTGLFQRPPEPMIYRVNTGQTLEITGHMMPMGRLAGRVLDAAGEPVPKAMVEVIGPGMQMNVATDAEGRFDYHKFTFPGAYTVSAIAPPGFPAPAKAADDDRVLAWTRTWYPGATEAAGAGKIVLAPGGSFENIELKLKSAVAHAVRGVLLGPGGKAAANVEVALSSLKGVLKAKTGEDGGFEFVVVDGDWRLRAEMQASFLNAVLRANGFVTVAGRDVEGIRLQLDAPISIRLQAIAEVPQGAAAPRFRAPRVVFTVVDRSGNAVSGDRTMTSPELDGTYKVSGVYPLEYVLGGPAPPGYYLAEIRLGETAVTGRRIELTAGAAVTLVYRADGATLRGAAENCNGGGVVLASQDPARRLPENISRVNCDDNGHYEFATLPPGAYYVVALQRGPDVYFQELNWSDALMQAAASVTLRANENGVADLKAVAVQQ
jgi:hypothetical protein